jgi:hypothetical protein
MSNINLTSVNQGTLWNLNNIKTISGVAGNILTISGNTSLSVMNLGTNIDVSGNLNANGNMILPNGTTANRPFGVQGYFRFNTTDSLLEFYTGSLWKNIIATSASPIVPSISARTITIQNLNTGFNNTYTWSSSFTTLSLAFVSRANLIATNNSSYSITVSGGTCYAFFTLLGAGGGGGWATAPPGGTGGYASGVVPLVPGTTYNLLIGQGGLAIQPNEANPNVPVGGGGLAGTVGYGGQGGGLTGLFYGNIVPGSATLTSVTAGNNSNSILISGGGGGASYEALPGGAGGGGGGGFTTPGAPSTNGGAGTDPGGGGGTWSGIGSNAGAGGAASQAGALAGVALQGGGCSGSGDGGGGGAGGGGFYGGGGGSGNGTGSGGGGGSGYIATYVFSASSSVGNGSAGGSGQGSGTNGVAVISYYG